MNESRPVSYAPSSVVRPPVPQEIAPPRPAPPTAVAERAEPQDEYSAALAANAELAAHWEENGAKRRAKPGATRTPAAPVKSEARKEAPDAREAEAAPQDTPKTRAEAPRLPAQPAGQPEVAEPGARETRTEARAEEGRQTAGRQIEQRQQELGVLQSQVTARQNQLGHLQIRLAEFRGALRETEAERERLASEDFLEHHDEIERLEGISFSLRKAIARDEKAHRETRQDLSQLKAQTEPQQLEVRTQVERRSELSDFWTMLREEGTNGNQGSPEPERRLDHNSNFLAD